MKHFGAVAVALSSIVTAPGGEAVKFEANWASLDKRPTPAWFAEGRFGIFIHWGVYSVPAWAPKGQYAEWYWNHMQNKKGATWQHHEKTYGADFKYEQFAPMFKAEKFNPDEWADLFARSGARYVVITSKHHDGFCLWPAPDSKGWNAVETGPKRDLLGDLTKAVRKTPVRMGFYYSLYEWFHPVYRSDTKRYVAEHALPQFKDLVARYAPDVVWPDGEWEQPDTAWRSEEFLAWLFNDSPCRESVAVNDRWGRGCRGRHGGYYTSEYGDHGGKSGTPHIWEECQGIGRSFGYNRNEGPQDYRTVQQLLHLLINCVANGGNLLLDIGPDGDGTIPAIMQERLLGMGAWLKANGESIYSCGAGPFRNPPWGRSTARPGKLYLHLYSWPKEALELRGLKNEVKKAWLLADPERKPLAVSRADDAVRIALPAEPPDKLVSVVALDIEGQAEIDATIRQAPDGSIALHASSATIHGSKARYESGGAKDNIGYWTDPADWVSWDFTVTKPGTFEVEVVQACAPGSGGDYTIAVGGQQLEAKAKQTASWDQYVTEKVGVLKLDRPGRYTLALKPKGKTGQALINLRAITLRPK
ncbi:MAG: carbohydrate-binding protein [Planctomycetes bacterium]|nr:carbohydrate-binding protein [Planctomycetota bacterium]